MCMLIENLDNTVNKLDLSVCDSCISHIQNVQLLKNTFNNLENSTLASENVTMDTKESVSYIRHFYHNLIKEQ